MRFSVCPRQETLLALFLPQLLLLSIRCRDSHLDHRRFLEQWAIRIGFCPTSWATSRLCQLDFSFLDGDEDLDDPFLVGMSCFLYARI